MTPQILLSPPDTGRLEADAVAAAMASGWIAPIGPDVDAFEDESAARAGTAYGVAVSSGTAALHLALLAAGVGRGDVVPTSSMTFAATANAIRYTGATPYFIDSEPDTGNIDVALLRSAMSTLASEGRRIGAVMPVDLLGRPVDYESIEALCAEFSVALISDAAESFGSTVAGRPVNNFGRASCVSFNGNKIMTTSGGGMVFTDDAAMATRVRHLASQARLSVAHYEHDEIGYNYRLSNILASLGRAQLARLPGMIERRRRWRAAYREILGSQPGVRVLGRDDTGDNCWLTAIVVDPALTGWRADALGMALADAGIETRPLWKPMHLQPAHAGAEASINGTSELLFRNGLTLPSGSAMSDDDFSRVRRSIEAFL